jgi:RND family efflux transporter MFP subunit
MSPETHSPQRAHRGLRLLFVAAAVAAAGVVATGLVVRAREHAALSEWTAEHARPHVSLVTPARTENGASLVLPGRLQAWTHAPIHARVSGYLARWTVDIGDAVHKGQLLGEIDTPDIDQQLLQARADLALAEANAGLAATTAARWESMLERNSVSRQSVDEKRGELAARRAEVAAARAAVDRLAATQEFARLVAPFDGTVTARNAEIGALVSADAGGAPPLFEISDTGRMRLYVNVPQVYLEHVRVGGEAEVSVPEHPGRRYRARIESMSGAVDVPTGASLVQLLLDNAAGELLPGGYASVSLPMPAAVDVLSIPASALVFDKAGMRVATVDAGNSVRMKAVSIARDLGSTVEIRAGLTPQDRVIENPPDGIADGVVVVPAATGG